MEIDNDKRASRAKMLLISIPFVLLLACSIPALFLLIHTWIPTIIAGILVIVGWAATFLLKLTSAKFRFEETGLSVFYYPISPMTSSFRRIDIAAGKLTRFEIVRSWGGLKNDLILYENIGGQEASYPPVSITLFDTEMLSVLNEYLFAYRSPGASS
jgi:hypothetical protein